MSLRYSLFYNFTVKQIQQSGYVTIGYYKLMTGNKYNLSNAYH